MTAATLTRPLARNSISIERAISERIALFGALLLIATIPVEDSFYFGTLTVSRVAGFAAIAACLWNLAISRRVVGDRTIGALLCAYGSWAVASYFWSFAPPATYSFALKLVQLVAMVAVIWQAMTTPLRARLALKALMVGGLIGAVLSVADSVAAHGGVPRYAIGDPNDFGISQSIAMLMTAYLLASTSTLRARVFYLAVICLDLLAITRTASRAATVSVILGFLVIACNRTLLRPKSIAAALAGVGIAMVGLVHFTSGAALQRLDGTAGAAASGNLDNRTAIWTLALHYWSSRPIFGLGGGAFEMRSSIDGGDKVAHSVFIGTLAELGIVGALILLGLLAICATRIYRLADRQMARFLFAAFAAWFCGALTLTLEVRKITWLLIAIASSAGVAAARRPMESAGSARAELLPPSADISLLTAPRDLHVDLFDEARDVAVSVSGPPARVRGGAVAFSCQAASTVLNFATQTALARLLGAESFGRYSFSINVSQLAAVPSDLGASSSVSRLIPEYQGKDDLSHVDGAARLAQLTTATVGCGVAGVAVAITAEFGTGPVSLGLLTAALVGVPLFALTLVQMNILRALGKVFAALGPGLLIQPVVVLGACLSRGSRLDARFVVVVTVVSLGLTTVLQSLLIRRALQRAGVDGPVRRSYDIARWRRISGPMLAINVTQLAFQRLDIVAVGILIDARSAGVYALANRMANLTSMMANSYANVVAPQLSKFHWGDRPAEAAELALRTIRITFLPALLVFAGFVVAGHRLLTVFGPSFRIGYWALVIYAAGQLIDSACGPVGFFALMIGQERQMFRQTVIGALISIAGYATLIPFLGIEGAALANAAGTVYKNMAATEIVRRQGYKVTLFRAIAKRRVSVNSAGEA